MKEDRFWVLASRSMAGEATPDDEVELQQMLEQQHDLRKQFDMLKAFWGNNPQRESIDVERSWKAVMTRISVDQTTRLGYSRFFLKAAASILIVLSVFVLLYAYNDTIQTYLTWEEKHTERGERSKIILPDGSIVTLNADSRLKFPEEFKESRQVYLSGEAFFEVKKNSSKPFVIRLDNGSIRVLGTSFNVKSFKKEPRVETSVVSGMVAFIPSTALNKDTLYLTQNTKAVLTKKSGQTVKMIVNSDEDRAWSEGKIIFRSSTMDEIVKVLERTYGKTIVLDNPAMAHCVLTGTFHENTLEQIIQLIAAAKDYHYKIIDNEWHLEGPGCPF
jgi:ferric-dicitrate binding protein FerR (iron transport regulator)